MSSLSLSSNSGSLEVWKCGNMSSLFLSNNSGSLEMWKYVFNCLYLILTLKCGNVEMCLHCLYLLTPGSVEMWRNVSSLSLSNKEDIFPHFHISSLPELLDKDNEDIFPHFPHFQIY